MYTIVPYHAMKSSKPRISFNGSRFYESFSREIASRAQIVAPRAIMQQRIGVSSFLLSASKPNPFATSSRPNNECILHNEEESRHVSRRFASGTYGVA